jgi:hypothetical protein
VVVGAEGASLYKVNLSGKRRLVGRHSGERFVKSHQRGRFSIRTELSGIKDREILF